MDHLIFVKKEKKTSRNLGRQGNCQKTFVLSINSLSLIIYSWSNLVHDLTYSSLIWLLSSPRIVYTCEIMIILFSHSFAPLNLLSSAFLLPIGTNTFDSMANYSCVGFAGINISQILTQILRQTDSGNKNTQQMWFHCYSAFDLM